MKTYNKILTILAAAAGLFSFAGCQEDVFDEIDTLELGRCLEPTKLKADVSPTKGNVVTFSWNVGKDAENYNLVICKDEDLTDVAMDTTILAEGIPAAITLQADQTFYFKVCAQSSQKKSSNWVVYKDDNGNTKSFKTKAVASNLYMKLSGRTDKTASFSWSKDVVDFRNVTHIEYAPVDDAENTERYDLTADDIANATATVSGLTPSTQYVFTLCYLSASRGEVNAWTCADPSAMTSVSTLAELTNAIKTPNAKIYLTQAGSPYLVASCDIANGFELYGEIASDGTLPVIQGEFHITDTFDGGNLYFESVEFNGVEETYGFAIQKKNGGAAEVTVGDITYKNCAITGYSKGLMYEWGKKINIKNFTYDNCEIYNVNKTGTVGGDGFDLRDLGSTIECLSFTNCTISQGFRTFVRGDASTKYGEIIFNNNTVYNLCFVDNTNNGGLFGFKSTTAPSKFEFKNNLIIAMGEKAMLTGNSRLKFSELNASASNNFFYNVFKNDAGEYPFFTYTTLVDAKCSILGSDPCYNSAAGIFNLTSEVAGTLEGVGASKWWTPFVLEPEDLTLTDMGASHTWDFTNAKYFSGAVERPMVRDGLALYASGTKFNVENGVLTFADAAATNKKGVPTTGYIAFMVSQPGSVVIRPENGGENHLVVAVGNIEQNDKETIKSTSVTVKGGASTLVDMGNAQKIVISDITEPSIIYIYPSGPIGISQLAWSKDVSAVNTALQAPIVTLSPKTFTAGESTDVVVSWDAVDNAGSYSVVFNGKTFAAVQDEETLAWSYTIAGKTTGMLDAGSYEVSVYANPEEGDIYNTMSEAGKAAFAVLPKASEGGEEASGTLVKSAEEFQSAIDAGKTDIIFAEGTYEIGQITVSAPMSLKGQSGATVVGAFILSGEVGSFKLDGINFKDNGYGCLITLGDAGVTASEVAVENCVLDGYAKSVIYGNYETAQIDKVLIKGNDTKNWGTGQGIFDFRKGTYGEIDIIGNTIVGGRDLIRLDAACVTGVVLIARNTIDHVTIDNGNGILYVRATVKDYRVVSNLILNETGTTTMLSKASGVQIPSTANNFFYNCSSEKFFTGLITEAIATANNGTVLAENPVKDSENYDYTLVGGLAISNRVGAPKWNPSNVVCDGASYTVKSADEFMSALDAGKTEITLAAEGSPYVFTGKSSFEAVKGLHIIGEAAADGKLPEFAAAFTMSGAEDLGEVVFENIRFVGGDSLGVVLTISGTPTARTIMMKNCEVDHFTKSVIYGNGVSTVQSMVFRGVTVTNHGTGQGVFDIRKGAYTNITIEQCTVTGGRDLIRADAGTITGAFNCTNNTIVRSNLGVNGNAIMYVRATPAAYKFQNNLFLNEVAEGKSVLLSKTSGVSVPTVAKNNFFYNCDTTNFFSGLFTKEVAGAVVLSYDPTRDSANGDYTLTDALCLSSNVGALRWNPNRGRVTTDFTASNVEELLTAIGAGKTAITLKNGTYDLTAVEGNDAVSGGVITITAPLTLKGEKKAGVGPEFIGAIKFGEGVSEFIAEGIVFNGNEKAIGSLLEVAAALNASKIIVRDCEVKAYNKSLIYGNAEGSIGTAMFSRLLVHDMGTGQGMFDLRKKVYGSLIIENSTIYNGGRDFVRCDAGVGESVTIKNNTLASTGLEATNGLLWIRSAVGDKYVVENNLFLNETGTATTLAKGGASSPVFKNNWFFNCSSEKFWTGAFTQEVATANGGGVLDADPCTNSAEFQFKLTNATMAGVGDPRWR